METERIKLIGGHFVACETFFSLLGKFVELFRKEIPGFVSQYTPAQLEKWEVQERGKFQKYSMEMDAAALNVFGGDWDPTYYHLLKAHMVDLWFKYGPIAFLSNQGTEHDNWRHVTYAKRHGQGFGKNVIKTLGSLLLDKYLESFYFFSSRKPAKRKRGANTDQAESQEASPEELTRSQSARNRVKEQVHSGIERKDTVKTDGQSVCTRALEAMRQRDLFSFLQIVFPTIQMPFTPERDGLFQCPECNSRVMHLDSHMRRSHQSSEKKYETALLESPLAPTYPSPFRRPKRRRVLRFPEGRSDPHPSASGEDEGSHDSQPCDDDEDEPSNDDEDEPSDDGEEEEGGLFAFCVDTDEEGGSDKQLSDVSS